MTVSLLFKMRVTNSENVGDKKSGGISRWSELCCMRKYYVAENSVGGNSATELQLHESNLKNSQ